MLESDVQWQVQSRKKLNWKTMSRFDFMLGSKYSKATCVDLNLPSDTIDGVGIVSAAKTEARYWKILLDLKLSHREKKNLAQKYHLT